MREVEQEGAREDHHGPGADHLLDRTVAGLPWSPTLSSVQRPSEPQEEEKEHYAGRI